MDPTDWFLLLIAGIMLLGIGAFVWNARRRARETETMRAALYAIAHTRQKFRTRESIPVTFDPSVNKAITRFAQTAVDIQGMIELAARYMVNRMSEWELEGMEPPEEWKPVTSQGIKKSRSKEEKTQPK